jgi:hypothetical protein
MLGEVFDAETSDVIQRWMWLHTQLLPCPWCRYHGALYMQQHPPRVTTGEEFWNYLVDFHNDVNERTKKLTYDSDEALALFEEEYSKRDYQGNGFSIDYWFPMLFASYIYTTKPDAPSEDEQKRLHEYLKLSAYVMPFRAREENGQTCRDAMLAVEIDTSTRQKALESVTNLYNSVCARFGNRALAPEEMKKQWESNFNNEDYKKLVSAHEMRLQDHAKMLEMQKKLDEAKDVSAIKALQDKLAMFEAGKCPSCQSVNDWTILAYVLMALVVILAATSAAFWYKARTAARVANNVRNFRNANDPQKIRVE